MHAAKITPFHFEEKIEVRTTIIDYEMSANLVH